MKPFDLARFGIAISPWWERALSEHCGASAVAKIRGKDLGPIALDAARWVAIWSRLCEALASRDPGRADGETACARR